MGRTPCRDKNGLKKGPWTPEEDLKLINYIQIHGAGHWRKLPKNAGLQRCGKSCRLRWTNYLRPDIKRGRFSFEEEETIIQLHSVLGNKWSAIACRLPGRTDNEIKNYWNTHIRKRLARNGIDPVTHAQRLDLVDLSSSIISSLLGVQALLNPQLLSLANTLLSLKQENPELLLQYLQQNQLLQTPTLEPRSQLLQAPMTDCSNQNSQKSYVLVSQPNYEHSNPNPTVPSLVSDNSHFHSMDGSQNFGLDSVRFTPISSPTPLHSSSTFINGSYTTHYEIERFNSLLKYEIPESLNINDLL
ncbi:hypothetical protein E1A91_D04G171100v1 [Gossypium mustelinum]|nr:hypothetical protein ES319_D04G169200v1 [Gossypium barbadense]TYH77806.1 hypothetical protein ES332_D04G180500v1 [Gossypium tomentosum]TYI87931.1 hypothetical protein E1A91_D04G171100v1 [Gossypium mustelinum]